MDGTFRKVVHYTKLIKIEGRLREFNFKKNNTAGDNVYDIDTADDKGNRVFFRATNDGTAWSIESKNKLPDWIINHTDIIYQEIEKGEDIAP